MTKNATLAICCGTSVIIYAGAVTLAYAKGKRNGRAEVIKAVHTDVKAAIKEMLENQSK